MRDDIWKSNEYKLRNVFDMTIGKLSSDHEIKIYI